MPSDPLQEHARADLIRGVSEGLHRAWKSVLDEPSPEALSRLLSDLGGAREPFQLEVRAAAVPRSEKSHGTTAP